MQSNASIYYTSKCSSSGALCSIWIIENMWLCIMAIVLISKNIFVSHFLTLIVDDLLPELLRWNCVTTFSWSSNVCLCVFYFRPFVCCTHQCPCLYAALVRVLVCLLCVCVCCECVCVVRRRQGLVYVFPPWHISFAGTSDSSRMRRNSSHESRSRQRRHWQPHRTAGKRQHNICRQILTIVLFVIVLALPLCATLLFIEEITLLYKWCIHFCTFHSFLCVCMLLVAVVVASLTCAVFLVCDSLCAYESIHFPHVT